jgi:phosphatidate cytidylyltransferase
MKDLSKRTLIGSLTVAVFAAVLAFSHHPVLQYFSPLFFVVGGAIAVWEYAQLVVTKGAKMISPALIGATALGIYSFFLASLSPRLAPLPLALFFAAFLLVFALHFGQKEGAIVDLAVSSFGLLYIALPVGMMVGILYMPDLPGALWMAYLVLVTKITDVGAYFGGHLFGRTKLAPVISPGKTVEGAIAGLACALGASYLFYWLGDGSSWGLSGVGAIALGFLLGVTSQFGDLAESLLKRDANKKDSNALPGIGGVLDMIDSLLFNTPILFFYLLWTPL